MKVGLLELLESRPIVHPTIITSLNLIESQLVVSLTGHPWWREGPSLENVPYQFHFEEVSDGFIDAALGSQVFGEQDNEALEYFSVQSLKNVGWAQSATCELFCSGALKSPLSLYSKLERYLEKAGAFKQPKDFLNCGQGAVPITTFAKIASESSFLLACVPEELCALLTDELDQQGVPHNVVRRADARVESRLHVRLDNSDFLCGFASATLPD